MGSKPHPAAPEGLADEDLMTLVDGKDADAFEVFYDRHGGAAYSLAHRIVGDPGIAEDVTQGASSRCGGGGRASAAGGGGDRTWARGSAGTRRSVACRGSPRRVPGSV